MPTPGKCPACELLELKDSALADIESIRHEIRVSVPDTPREERAVRRLPRAEAQLTRITDLLTLIPHTCKLNLGGNQ